MQKAPRELQVFVYYFPRRRGAGASAQILAMWANEAAEVAVEAVTPMLGLAPLLQQGAQMVPYRVFMAPQNPAHTGQQTLRGRSGLVSMLNRDTAEAISTLLEDGKVPWAQFRWKGGAVNDVPADATAYAHRSQEVLFSEMDLYPDRRRLDPAWQRFLPFVNGNHLNLETDISERTVREIYPTPTDERIQRLKTQYDLDNVFNRNFNIPPVES